jgi:hypothetical protein
VILDRDNAQWRKGSYSSTNGGNCVMVALNLPGAVAVCDSKDPDSETLVLTPNNGRCSYKLPGQASLITKN